MQNFLYKKDTFIYEKNNSITHELCKDIIELFENDFSNNNCYNIDCNPNFHKIKGYLKQELEKNINDYERKINKIKNYNILKDY